MIRRVFVDSDVILDLLLRRDPFFPAATRLFVLIQDNKLEGYMSPLICSNLFYILRKHLSREKARSAIGKLRALLRILAIDERIVDMALSSSFKDFEDALQYYTALTYGLDAVVTRNTADYASADLPIFTASECVVAYEAAVRSSEKRPTKRW